MADEEWIETEIRNMESREPVIPKAALDLLGAILKDNLHKAPLTAAGSVQVAGDLLATLRPKEVRDAD